jgi:3-hydroxyacyl-CoA dehydrogenase/enoyl-CoA hydratase/3-hydroxybutyryl-CoA epimerase
MITETPTMRAKGEGETKSTAQWSLLSLQDMGEGIHAILFDRPGSRVNLIDETWERELTAAIDEAERRRARGLLLLSAKPEQFIAGADVAIIASLTSAQEAESKSREGQKLLNRIADLPIPTVAAISGPCLGGGLELALACRHRVAVESDRAVLGLPEVRLGILPGFGGTFRLPRLIGVTQALDLATTGRNVRPRQARRLGLVDRIVPAPQLTSAAMKIAQQGIPPRRRAWGRKVVDAFLTGTPFMRNATQEILRANARRKTAGHYPAPEIIIERILQGMGLPREEALAREAEAFGRLAVSREARNLLWLFQANENLGRSASTVTAEDRTQRGAVLGAGTMGGGIAGALAENGSTVRMRDISNEALRAGLAAAASPLLRRSAQGRLSSRERDAILARISPTTEWTGFRRVDFVIEAVPEVFDLKVRVLREVESLIPVRAILASNTSSLSITRMGSELRDPTRFLGMHFFNPVHRMPLVEIIPGRGTSRAVVDRAVLLASRLRKSPLIVADSPGFLVNRLLLPYLNEAALAVDEGWPVDRIDRAMEKFGMPMGPLRVLDEVGLDVAQHVSAVLQDAFGERAKPAPVLNRLVRDKALGVKSGRGFWIHEKKRRRPNRAAIGSSGTQSNLPPDSEIVDRLLMGMVLESSRALAEEIVSEPGHIDLGTVLGAGFPPFHGGIRRWALSIGETEVRRRLDRLTNSYGNRFAPGPELTLLFR